ncbi:DJ-1/PfpI family protein [Streptomyces sp. NPDC006552]|uniref:DJ-1/PfpI family protein n=1 Tax=Streptomyces sp. NPDC006552 TaxID=3157179 RepID=UPI0033BB0227
MHVQIVLFDGFDPLDVIAPFEVFHAGGTASGGGVEVALVSAEGPRDVVSGTGGLTLRATAALDPARGGLVVVPGASGPVGAESAAEAVGVGGAAPSTAEAADEDGAAPGVAAVVGVDGRAPETPAAGEGGAAPETAGANGVGEGAAGAGVEGEATIPVLLGRTLSTKLPALLAAAMADAGTTVACVCGGSLVLALAGLLEGRPATTHHLGLDLLDATGARAVRARVVDDGDLVTGAGVTSGLDLGLYLLEREVGPQVAHAVEGMFAYERRGTVWRPVGPAPTAF